ncbi:MAG: hypothetical protein M3P84_11190 [Chloroflexota bacterium]|nr:hypothetical protein [Chloroflexota bacterium]
MTTPILAIVGVGLLAAAVVAALVLRGGGAPSAATATPTSAPSTAAPSVGPPSTPDADDLALQRFWVLIADPKLSYHVETKGGGTIGTEEAYTFSESLDVSGDSWAGTERAHGLGSGGVTSIVTIDTEVWFKFPDGWHKNIEHDPYFRSRPFLDLGTQRDLIVSGTAERAGKTLYKLKSTTNYQPYPGRLIGFLSMGIRVDTLELDILVTADGVPVEATVHILAGGLGSNGKPQLDAKSTRTFTKFGATFTINAPKP